MAECKSSRNEEITFLGICLSFLGIVVSFVGFVAVTKGMDGLALWAMVGAVLILLAVFYLTHFMGGAEA